MLVGYAGHAYVAADILLARGHRLAGYCDDRIKVENPFGLAYLGDERRADVLGSLTSHSFFIGVGNNTIRNRIYQYLVSAGITRFPSAIHPRATVAGTATLGVGVLVAAGALLNPLVTVETGAICNTGAIVEHECHIGAFAHVAPGAVLAGNVRVGSFTFVGANAVVKQGTVIGKNAIIGAGAVVLRDVPDGTTVVGNPARRLPKIKL